MSFLAAAAAIKCPAELTAYEFLLLIVLGDGANQDNRLWPSQATIAKDSRMSLRSVRDGLASLERKGLISRQCRYNAENSRLSDIITINLEVEVRLKPPRHVAPGAPQQELPHPPAGAAGNPTTEPKEESPIAPKGAGPTVRQADVDAVWEIAPLKSRQRSTSKEEVREALRGAYKRGRSLEEILAGLKGYYTSREATREEGRFMKGVHRIITKDRYAAFTEAARVHRIEDSSPWPGRLQRWVSTLDWDDVAWGPQPGQAGCKAPPDATAKAIEARAAEKARILAARAQQAS
jgi:hypothetical protein